MTPSEFVRLGRKLCPTFADLARYGIAPDDEEAADIRRSFRLPRRTTRLKLKTPTALHALLAFYDTRGFAFRALEFSKPKRIRSGVCFAHCEADELVVYDLGPVVVLDHETGGSAIVAENGDLFVEALAFLIRADISRRPRSFSKTVERAVVLAGGSRASAGFWRTIAPKK